MNTEEYIALLKDLISTPSYSREEEKTAKIIADFFSLRSIDAKRIKNNIIVKNKYFDESLPTILLNSHHDTVKPNSSWEKDPFTPIQINGKLYGLGSNDAGGCLVSLVASFIHFYEQKGLKYNLLFVASAEEEVSGKDGIELVLREVGHADFAIVGEPTSLKMAVAEKGLMVLDCESIGISGHAARTGGKNAIYMAMKDIDWFRSYKFDKSSSILGETKMNVTMINSGTNHNVIPDTCKFVVDVRSTDAYKNEEVLEIIKHHVECDVTARSTRLQPSGLLSDHVLRKAAFDLGITTFGSPTLSDQALMPFPSVKIGPGDSARSHTADEYIEVIEVEDGIGMYIKILDKVLLNNC